MTEHFPVMIQEVLDAVNPQDGDVIIDGTFGAGGYSRAFLDRANCTVIAIDQDPEALVRAATFEKDYGARFVFIPGRFGDVSKLLQSKGFDQVDAFVLDVGVSSMQIDQAERGFSFQKDGPLDMRMNNKEGPSAADLVANLPEEELANIIYQYGEERYSRRIARKIVEVRQENPINTTNVLADLVRSVVPCSPKDKIDPATRTFQALRIAVNDELGELERALKESELILSEGGRLVIVSFHSLEDRIVKNFLRDKSGASDNASRHMPDMNISAD
ncbi:MAG: 16S rRNA (cytosine(1402)-N(4))-methyltransferase RsmH, partial [Pseudomonadota bacterium]